MVVDIKNKRMGHYWKVLTQEKRRSQTETYLSQRS